MNAPTRLRPYQTDLHEAACKAIDASESLLIQSPTGSGKGVMIGSAVAYCASKGVPVTIVIHRVEIADQLETHLMRAGVMSSVINSTRSGDATAGVLIISPGSFRRIQSERGGVLLRDEAHRSATPTDRKIKEAIAPTLELGYTATPCRLDGKPLDMYDTLVCGPSVLELTEAGYLCPQTTYAPSERATRAMLDGLKTRAGEYDAKESAGRMIKISGNTVRLQRKYAAGKRTVVFCVSIDHAESVTRRFKEEGVTAEVLHSKLSRAERQRVVETFRKGEIEVLCSIDVITEGFDCPEIECAILARPTQSLCRYLQQVGRALRIAPGKDEAIFIDQVGNHYLHGTPDDDREWSLEGKPQRKGKPKRKVNLLDDYIATGITRAEVDAVFEKLSDTKAKLEERERLKAERAQRKVEREARAAERKAQIQHEEQERREAFENAATDPDMQIDGASAVTPTARTIIGVARAGQMPTAKARAFCTEWGLASENRGWAEGVRHEILAVAILKIWQAAGLYHRVQATPPVMRLMANATRRPSMPALRAMAKRAGYKEGSAYYAHKEATARR